MSQIARNLTDAEEGILTGKRYLIHDRAPLFPAEFLSMIADAGVESVNLPPRSPNLNAYAERFVRSIKESCLERLIFFGDESLRAAIQNFVAHYHAERNHSAWRTNSSAQRLATSTMQARSSGGSAWAACCTTTIAPLPESEL
jgi:transposase InsO family protein